jgi:hypothetical protein
MIYRQLLTELTKVTMLCTELTSFNGQMADFCIKSVQCPGSNTTEFPLQSLLQGVTICKTLHLTLTPCNVYLPPATPVATAAPISLISKLCPPDSSL